MSRIRVGVFDSGIGGLSILQALCEQLPQHDFIYIADSGHAPYGERDDEHVLARSHAIADYLLRQDIQALVIACNTATAAAIEALRERHPGLAIIGVEPALKPALLISQTRRIGVMATRSTLASARFGLLREALADQAEFVLQPCDGLAEAIERAVGAPENSAFATTLIAECARHTRAMGQFGIKPGEMDSLVLGCTHYPFASAHLRQLMGPEVQFIDTGAAVARQTRRLLTELADYPLAKACGQIRLLSTGDPQLLQTAAAHWLNLTCEVESLTL